MLTPFEHEMRSAASSRTPNTGWLGRIAHRSKDRFAGLSITCLAQGLQARLIIEASSAEKNLLHTAATVHKCCKPAFREAVLS